MNAENNKLERFVAPRSGRTFGGLVLVVIGGILLSRQFGVDIPEWLLTWEMFLIALGVFLGARRAFRPGGWLVLVLVGGAFILNDFYPEITLRHYIWPVAIILLGLLMILKPRRRKRDWPVERITSADDLEVNSIFGGSKKKIVTKDFKGGEINTVFGGNDLDLSQADISGQAVIEINVIFGGTKLIVPPHWKIQSEIDCIFASVEDKRRDAAEVDPGKVLVLKGSVVFGSVELKSY